MFAVGDIVKMSEVGEVRYDNEEYNPHDMLGEVVSVSGTIMPLGQESYQVSTLQVRWINGNVNSYSRFDLELYTPIGYFFRLHSNKSFTHFSQIKDLIGFTILDERNCKVITKNNIIIYEYEKIETNN